MCGIVLYSDNYTYDQVSQSHRGPDFHYQTSHNKLKINFDRLSITGAKLGNPPVLSSDDRWSVFLNGEIYNFSKLIYQYNLPSTTSDTKTIANGLSKYGISFFKKIAGQFAVIAIDNLSNKVYIARDQLGEKPLYFSKNAQEIVVTSEFRTNLMILKRKLNLNLDALSSYFRFGYVEEPITMDSQIFHFPKGKVYELNGISHEWSEVLDLFGHDGIATSYVENQSFHDFIYEILKEQSQTDVKSGVALSSGIDSKIIAKSLLLNSPLRKSYTYKNSLLPWRSEHSNALSFSKEIGLEYKVVTPKRRDLFESLVELNSRNNDLHADTSGLAYMQLLSAMQNDQVKVAFFGHGSDEFFQGYAWYNHHVKSLKDKKNQPKRYFWNTPAFSPEICRLFEIPENVNLSSDPNLNSKDPLIKSRAEIVNSYLVGNGFKQIDRLSMSFGIESRLPLADFRIYSALQRSSDADVRNFSKSDLALGFGVKAKANYVKKGFSTSLLINMENDIPKEKWQHITNIIQRSVNLDWDKFDLSNVETLTKYKYLMLGLWLQAVG
jgi:asparagine synthase (glutamine-hydrolysing)